MSESRRHPDAIDRRSPWVFDVRDVGHQAGSMKTFAFTLPAPADLRVEMVAAPQGSDAVLDLRLESVMEGVLASGEVTVVIAGECGRCLEPFRSELSVPFQELFAYPSSTTEQTTSEDDVRRLAGDYLDLEPVIRDAVVLALPTNPVCRPDCLGLCSGCGLPLEDLPSDHHHEDLDPRWGALEALRDPSETN